jgi:hypothetical protein
MSKPPPTAPPSPEEMVATALNEQGFLFSQVVRDHIHEGQEKLPVSDRKWRIHAREYPVTAADGSQTRIDLLLRHANARGLHLCLECKRADPRFKQWVVFDPVSPNADISDFFFEAFSTSRRPITPESGAHHGLVRQPKTIQFPIFHSYLETIVNREKKAGHTETIEDAMMQVIRGQTGLVAKLMHFQEDFRVAAVPVVVTTAQLVKADFQTNSIALHDGTIQSADLTLQPLGFCAVNYHPNDKLATRTKFTPEPHSIEMDMQNFQTRTVFVVQASAIREFLTWANTHLTTGI